MHAMIRVPFLFPLLPHGNLGIPTLLDDPFLVFHVCVGGGGGGGDATGTERGDGAAVECRSQRRQQLGRGRFREMKRQGATS